MSRALILIAQARFLKRPLTAEETLECVRIWSELAGGERVCVPRLLAEKVRDAERVKELRAQGKTWRAVANELGMDKETARRCLKSLPAAETETEPT